MGGQYVKLLGVSIDRELKFDTHISNICSVANKKLCALKRLTKILHFEQKRILLKAFFDAQFNYCPLVHRKKIFICDRHISALYYPTEISEKAKMNYYRNKIMI